MIVKRIYDDKEKLYATLNVDGPFLSLVLHKTDSSDIKVTLDKRILPSLIESLQEIDAVENII